MYLTRGIIFITTAISVYAFYRPEWLKKLLFFPFVMNKRHEAYRIVTYAFVHANWLHLIINMYVLYIFGEGITEYAYRMVFAEKGKFFYLLLYIGGITTSVIPSYEMQKNNPAYSAVGASGAVSAVVFASILFNPLMNLNIMFVPIDIPAYVFGGLYLVFSYYMARRGSDKIGHDAHLFGALFGIMFTILLDYDIAVRFYHAVSSVWSH